jgi:protein involved in polysaccharide export with SLBB domain
MKKVIAALLLSTAFVSAQDATFRPGDSLEVRIGSVPQDEIGQVSGLYTIDNQGYINLPHIGKVKAVGNTPGEMQSEIERAYKAAEIYRHPTISITMVGGGSSRFVSVSGEIKGGGRMLYTPDMTILSAISAAGGFTDYADKKNVQLIRGGQRQRINLREVSRNPSLDIKLLPGDIIQVPQGLF